MRSKLLAFFAFLSAILWGLLGREKAKSAKRERDIAKASEKAGERSTEALIRGLKNEADTSDNDNYFK